MAINKVGTKGITDGAISAIDFADNTITSGKLVNSAITNALLSNSSITLSGTSITLGASASFTNKFVDWQSVITGAGSSSTAVAGKGYFINTTSAVHTLNLPASASIGDFVAIKDYAGTFATYNLTIGRNGHNIQGVANDSLITTNRASLVLVYVDATKGWLYWEEHNVGDLGAPLFITATGGTITTSGNFKIHSFTGDGCFVVSQLGNPVGGPSNVDYLVVAGGGGGGAGHPSSGAAGSGSGAGGFRESSGAASGCYTASPLGSGVSALPVSATTYPVTVGAGGSAATSSTPPGPTKAGDGSNSVFSTITSTGGGYGGSRSWGNPGTGGSGTNTDGRSDGGPGGSGGGGNIFCAPSLTSAPAGTGNTPPVSPSQGTNGGTYSFPGNGSTGGGGATVAGSANSPTSTAGAGGTGATTNITASPVAYAGGGGGGFVAPAGAGAGGNGGGGTGGTPNGGNGSNGTANSGGGAGGGGRGNCAPAAGNGGGGGSGIVVIRYKFQ
jgi:hypothetical protein